nr:MAG TPA: hypothetical protein [Inoviridae sp.]
MRFLSGRKCKAFFLAIFASVFIVFPAYADETIVAVVPDYLSHAQFIGGGWIRGTAVGLGDVELYFPLSSSGSWGLTPSNYLCSVNSSSVSGIMYDSSGRQYTVSCSGFSIPRYRLANSSGYQYEDLSVKVYDSNLSVARAFPSSWRMDNGWYYLVIAFLGVILICLMRYKR